MRFAAVINEDPSIVELEFFEELALVEIDFEISEAESLLDNLEELTRDSNDVSSFSTFSSCDSFLEIIVLSMESSETDGADSMFGFILELSESGTLLMKADEGSSDDFIVLSPSLTETDWPNELDSLVCISEADASERYDGVGSFECIDFPEIVELSDLFLSASGSMNSFSRTDSRVAGTSDSSDSFPLLFILYEELREIDSVCFIDSDSPDVSVTRSLTVDVSSKEEENFVLLESPAVILDDGISYE